jgi:hypothetical protein
MLRYILFAFTGALILHACQYPVGSTKLPSPEKFLIIDAVLTEQYGKIKVGWTLTGVSTKGAYITPAPPQATAYVKDSQGNTHTFSVNGTIDSTFKGIVGETYQLFVQADGEWYESKKETIRACPEMDSVAPVYRRETFRSPEDRYYDGFDIYAHFQDTPGEENFYQWDWVNYQRTTACDRKVIQGVTYYVPCTPYDCWGIYQNTQIIIQSDKLRDGSAITNKLVRVPFAQPPNKYYLRVEQRAITPSVYQYLKSQETQTQNVGSIFDIPAQTQFNPNIHNVNNPEEKLLGVFSVFSSRRKIIFINMLQQIPGAKVKTSTDLTPRIPDPLAQAPCIESSTRTQKKPEGWED